MTSAVDASPNVVQIGQGETFPITVDFTNRMAVGQTLSSPTSALNDLTSGELFTLGISGSAAVVGATIRQSYTGAYMVRGRRYEALLGATLEAGNIQVGRFVLECV